MAPTKSKARDDDEDISQLRKPITLHGKPVEQILNSIHYGSPELRSLLMNECDIIFECKVCRALFRDLPNFIAHKRRYCSKSAADFNHFSIAELPDEKVVVVHPKPAEDEAEIIETSSQSTSSRTSLEDTLQRIHNAESGKSHAFKVQSDAAAKLRRQKENAKITCIRTRSIPTNSNALFVDVSTTCVNFHERPSASGNNDKSSSSVKTVIKKAGDKSKNSEGTQLRSKSSNKPKEDSNDISNILMRELKAIQSKGKQNAQSHKVEKVQQEQSTKAAVVASSPQPKKKVCSEESVVKSPRENGLIHSRILDEAGLVEIKRQDVKAALVKTEKAFKEGDVKAALGKMKKAPKEEDEEVSSEVSSSNSSSERGAVVSQRSLRKNKNSLICSKCGNIFSCKRSLRFHVKVHHSVKRTFYPCPLCSRVYYFLHAATRHLEINHDKTKQEISEMREEIKSKAFVKPIPIQESLKSAKSSMMSTRKDGRSRRKVNNAPYVYSSMNRGNRLPSKKDSILNGNHTSEKKEESTECKSPVKSSRLRHKQSITEIKEESKTPAVNGNKMPLSSSVKKHSNDIDSQMQSCPKCSRLFGRKATFENHVKICEGKAHSVSSSENKCLLDSNENTSVSTRRKGKETNTPSIPESSSSSGKDEIDCCESSSTSTGTNCHHKSTTSSKVNLAKQPPNAEKLHASPHKTLPDSSADSSFTVTRLKSRSSSEICNISSTATTNLDQSIFKMDIALPLMKGNQITTAITDKSCLDSGKDDSRRNVVNKEGKTEVMGLVSNVLERPRRKRKVPSRNIGAVELLQKIHRVEKKEEAPSGTKFRKVEDGDIGVGGVLRTRATANKVFVLNSTNTGTSKSKLQCYNHSRVNKFIDEKKMACLKCGSKFSFMHNLKRHIIRLHLKWSRFQCKLCNFNCFDKSECNTHIIRRHRNGQKPVRNHFFNTLIIDLAKKGSKAMALKKHQTLIAKSREKDDEKNIYRNRNAQKVPRLHERTSDSNNSISPPAATTSIEKQKTNQKEVKKEIPDKLKKDIKVVQKVSHLVARTLRTATQTLNTGVSIEKIAQSTNIGTAIEKSKPPSSNNETSMEKMKAQTSNITGMLVEKTKSESTNTVISTEKKPKLESTSTGVSTEKTKSQSVNTVTFVEKTKHPSAITGVEINKPSATHAGTSKEKTKSESTNAGTSIERTKTHSVTMGTYVEKTKSQSINTGNRVDKTKHQFAITGVEICEPLSPEAETSTENDMKPPDSALNPKLDKEATATKSSHCNSNLSVATSTVRKTSLPFNISTRNSPRVFDTTPYTRVEAATVTITDQTTLTKEEIKPSLETTKEAAVIIVTKAPDKTSSCDEEKLKNKKEEITVNGLDLDVEEELTISENMDSTCSTGSNDDVNSYVPDNDPLFVKSSSLTVSETLMDTVSDSLSNSDEKMDMIVIDQSPAEWSNAQL